MKNNDYAIEVHNINKHFGDKHVVRGISLTVNRGEIFGFLGPNGSGKTTSIRMMCGLLTADSGKGTCLGYDIFSQRDQIKRQVGYMTQRFSMWEDLTIRENLDFVARIYEISDHKKKVQNVLEQLGLAERANQLAGALSGGWKQRLALSACLLHDPQLLLLDEPTAGVDPEARKEFWEELHRLAAKGISILVTTHYMDEAERCHKLAYIYNGRLIVEGTSEEIIAGEKLSTLAISGNNLDELASRLENVEGVDQVIVFGRMLHVSGIDQTKLDEAIKKIGQNYQIKVESVETGLEEVFIHLMNRSKKE